VDGKIDDSREARAVSTVLVVLAMAALVASFVGTLPTEAAVTASASVGVRILAPADMEIASGAVSVSSLSSLDWTGSPSVRRGQAVAIRVSPGADRTTESGAAQWLLRGGRSAARTLSVPDEAVVRSAAGELRVSGLSLRADEPKADAGGAVTMTLGGDFEIGPEAPAGTYVGNVLVVTAWE
jgi:spore coat protein U-like protein